MSSWFTKINQTGAIPLSSLSETLQNIIRSMFGKKITFVTREQLSTVRDRLKPKAMGVEDLSKRIPAELLGVAQKYFPDGNITREAIEQKIEELRSGKGEGLKKYHILEQEWTGGQKFDKKTQERVIPIHMSSDDYVELSNDPILKKFLGIQSNHFSNVTQPLGWVLVSPIKPDTWVINQIQSDVMSQFLATKKKLLAPKGIDVQELENRLNAGGKGVFIKALLAFPVIQEALCNKPRLINILPNVANEQEAQQWLASNGTRFRNEEEEDEIVSDISEEEVKYIDEKMSYLIQGWVNICLANVFYMARKEGVKHIYMNTSESIDYHSQAAGGHSGKKNFFYEQLPQRWGFTKNKTNLRGVDEQLWYRRASSLRMVK